MLLTETDRETLLKGLSSVTGIVERRHTLPILSNVLVQGQPGRLGFLASDLEIQIHAETAPVEVQAPFQTTCSARKLQDILRALPEGTRVSLESSDSRLVLKAGKSRFTLQTLPAEDFPRFSAGEGGELAISLTQKTLRQAIQLVAFAMAQADIRYYLNGMLMVIGQGEMRLVATDGHRLSLCKRELEQAQGEAREIIIPRKTVLEVQRLLAESEEPVSVRAGKNHVHFSFGNISLDSKVVDGKFPDYTRVIPGGYGNRFRVDRVMLLQALQRAAILSNEKVRGVRLVLTKDSLKVLSSNAEQEEAQEELEIEYAGDALDIGFNVSYLMDVLSHGESKEVEWALGDSSSSALITAPDDPGFQYVVMPMRI
ncbi:DNA polymerase III subunit beta [Thiobacter aerophilum]|uniref:Beta sliding clamp n=1 Tax=Thiobacter aerophilum TaxID=3121275 RepID=A0ABV0ECY3_9BURK